MFVRHAAYHPEHHWLSQGTPSRSPSICVPGQLRMKNFASSHERIWLQWIRPSHWNGEAAACAGSRLDCGRVAARSAAGGANALRSWNHVAPA